MIIESEIILKCPLCDGDKLKPLALTLRPDMPHFCRVRCDSCGLVISSPMATQSTLNNYYENYYSKGSHASVTEGSGYSKRLESAKDTVNEILQFCGEGKFLDVGSGSGHVCHAADLVGFDVYGVDLSESGVEYTKDRFHLKNITCGEIFDGSYDDNTFDVIHCWHLIEHVRNPSAYMSEISRILKPGGYLYWGTDNHYSLGYKLLRLFSFLLQRFPPIYDGIEHTFGFDKNTITMLIEKAGLKSVMLKTYPDPLSLAEIRSDMKNSGVGKAFRTLAQSIFHVKMKGIASK